MSLLETQTWAYWQCAFKTRHRDLQPEDQARAVETIGMVARHSVSRRLRNASAQDFTRLRRVVPPYRGDAA